MSFCVGLPDANKGSVLVADFVDAVARAVEDEDDAGEVEVFEVGGLLEEEARNVLARAPLFDLFVRRGLLCGGVVEGEASTIAGEDIEEFILCQDVVIAYLLDEFEGHFVVVAVRDVVFAFIAWHFFGLWGFDGCGEDLGGIFYG